MKINGYKIFENYDEAIYVAKSKEDVYNYFIEMYGSTEECQGETKDQFINGLFEIELDSEPAIMVRNFHSDDTGEICKKSYLDEYKKVAIKDIGTDVIAYLFW